MAPRIGQDRIYEFGKFRLDVGQLMLYRAGDEIPMAPKAVETLVALIERRGQIISKDDLMSAIWADTIVEESNLARYIHVLRSTLGDQPNGKPYIETFRRRGYRFNAEIKEVRDSPTVLTAIHPSPPMPVGAGAMREATTGNVIAVPQWRRDPADARQSEVMADAGLEVVPAGTIGPKVRLYRRWFVLASAIIVQAGIASVVYFSTLPSPPPLTDKDVILIADFENKTGDEIFDDTLKQALATQLRESPFLGLFSDERVRLALKLMKRSPDEKITREIGREMCQRQGLKAFIVGSIAQLGKRYVLVLEAIDAQSDDVLASELSEADGREQILKALAQAAGSIREKLGESLASIKPLDYRLEAYTTSSLDALKVLSLAGKESRKGNWPQTIQLSIKATEIDPEFASAYRTLSLSYLNNQLFDLAAQAATKAYELRERVSGQERLEIEYQYFRSVTLELDKAAEICELRKQLYPRDFRANGNLAEFYYTSGRFEDAITEAKSGIDKGAMVVYSTLSNAQLKLGRYEEARATIDKTMELGYESQWTRRALVELAFVNNDDAEFENQLKIIEQRPYKHLASDFRALRALYGGQARNASDFLREDDRIASQENLPKSDSFMSDVSSFAPFLGLCPHSQPVNSGAGALTHAICGEPAKARVIIAKASARAPNGSLLNNLLRPLVEAAIELQGGNPRGAIESLRVIPPNWESGSQFRVQYLRGQAYLKLKQGPEAAVEFQKIIDNRSEGILSPLYPLAYLGMARAQVLTGDLENACQNYEWFFDIWKNADSGLPILIEARREYARLEAQQRSR